MQSQRPVIIDQWLSWSGLVSIIDTYAQRARESKKIYSFKVHISKQMMPGTQV